MPALEDHHSSKFVKIIYIGDSSTGKTGSLTSLVKDGYNVRILDFDNGIDVLKEFVKRECPEKIKQVDYETVRDKISVGPAGPRVKDPVAFTNGLKLMDTWYDGSKPSEWGEKTIFVLDSLSAFGRAAFAWARGLNPTAKDPRQWYHAAQQGVEDTIGLLTSEAFHANVIVISHVNYKEVTEGVTKGYTNSIGTALGPVIPRYFNTLILAESSGAGKSVVRTIRTVPSPLIDLKNPAPFKIDEVLPLSSGLATIFNKLKES